MVRVGPQRHKYKKKKKKMNCGYGTRSRLVLLNFVHRRHVINTQRFGSYVCFLLKVWKQGHLPKRRTVIISRRQTKSDKGKVLHN